MPDVIMVRGDGDDKDVPRRYERISKMTKQQVESVIEMLIRTAKNMLKRAAVLKAEPKKIKKVLDEIYDTYLEDYNTAVKQARKKAA